MNPKILLPVDFSPLSSVSCDYAAGFAQLTGRDVILFHSFFDQIYFSDGGFSTGFESGIMLTDELILDLYKKKETRLAEMAAQCARKLAASGKAGSSFETLIESGDPEVQIPNACRNLKPGLVIMGSAGLGLKGRFPGSVCEKIMKNCGLPVMAIPETAVFKGLEQVVYMTEFNPSDPEAIRLLSETLSLASIRVDCLHLCPESDHQLALDKMDSLRTVVDAMNLPQSFQFVVKASYDLPRSLREFVDEKMVRLIAFIPHHRSFFKSLLHQDLTKKDLFLTQTPILSLP